MVKVRINENMIELSDIQLLVLISNTVVSIFDSAKEVYTADLLVQPLKIRKTHCDNLSKTFDHLDDLQKGISDDNLHNAIANLRLASISLISNGEKIHDWVSGKRTQRKKKTSSRTKPPTETGNDSLQIGFPFPEWYLDSQFQDLLSESSKSMEKIVQSTEQAIESLRLLRQGKNIDDKPQSEEQVLNEIPPIRSIIKYGLIKVIQDNASDNM